MDTVRAAGGLVTRHRGSSLEIVLVHRPRRGDWSIPKGRVHPAESLEDCALREVEEETGYRCELGRELGSIEYRDRRNRRKQVRYWEMDPISGAFVPSVEVDEIRWVALAEAPDVLTRARERPIVDALVALESVPLLV